MKPRTKRICCAFSLMLSVIYPQKTWADSVTNSDFLGFTNEQKKAWLNSAIDTLGFVAAYKNKDQGRCVWEWYASDVAKKNGLIEAYMKQHPDKSPSAILIGLTENACGAYVRTETARNRSSG